VKLTPTKSNLTGVGRVDALAALNAVAAPEGVNENRIEAKIYPNPASNAVTIECEGLKQVKVFDANGNLLKISESKDATLQIDDLASGVYLVRIETEKGTVARRIVKM